MAGTGVVIVGSGPVGMVLALELARLGVRSVLVEQADATDGYPPTLRYPKGNTHNARTMEHYRRLGLAGAVRAVGLPGDHPTDVAYFTTMAGYELQRLRMPSGDEKLSALAEAAPTDQVPEPLHRANQMYVERVLFDRVAATPEVTRLYGWTYTGHADDGAGVEASLAQVDGGAEQTVRAAYLVGCDGPRSEVRRALGISYQGEDAREEGFMSGVTRSAYLRIPDLLARAVRRPAWQYWILRPESVCNLITLGDEHEYLFHAVRGEAEGDDAVRRLVRECVGVPVEVQVLEAKEWIAGRALVAEPYGLGRVLLCGDAVHLFTPTGGFGMNTGIDDAANLAWKLAASVHGWAGQRLVASYGAERRPVGVRNTRAALNLAKGLKGIPLGPVLEAATDDGERARRIAGDVLGGFAEEFASLGIQLGARYEGSPLVVDDGSTPPPDEPTVYLPSATPGGRAPHVWLGPGRSLFDGFGAGFTLLRLVGDGGDCRATAAPSGALAEAAAAHRVPLTVLDVPGVPARDLYGADLALVRPDHHVAWRGNAVPTDAAGLLATVTGRTV
jgi:2-polyprenyl-6-methoxyphenol hydroxylase-like FAD-dependent oxidoreductase